MYEGVAWRKSMKHVIRVNHLSGVRSHIWILYIHMYIRISNYIYIYICTNKGVAWHMSMRHDSFIWVNSFIQVRHDSFVPWLILFKTHDSWLMTHDSWLIHSSQHIHMIQWGMTHSFIPWLIYIMTHDSFIRVKEAWLVHTMTHSYHDSWLMTLDSWLMTHPYHWLVWMAWLIHEASLIHMGWLRLVGCFKI